MSGSCLDRLTRASAESAVCMGRRAIMHVIVLQCGPHLSAPLPPLLGGLR